MILLHLKGKFVGESRQLTKFVKTLDNADPVDLAESRRSRQSSGERWIFNVDEVLANPEARD